MKVLSLNKYRTSGFRRPAVDFLEFYVDDKPLSTLIDRFYNSAGKV